jgi:hypothetical protein
MLVFPFRGWWAPGRSGLASWRVAGLSVPERVPVLVLGRAGGRGPRSWAVVFPASLAWVGGAGVGGFVVCPGSSVRAAAAGQAGVFGRQAWSAAWSAFGPVAWAAVVGQAPVGLRQRWSGSVPGSLASAQQAPVVRRLRRGQR